MPTLTPKDVFSGAGQMLQYSHSFCRSGVHLDPILKKSSVATNRFCSIEHKMYFFLSCKDAVVVFLDTMKD